MSLFGQTQTITYSTPGSKLFTVPAGVTSITVEAWGGGGGGGNSNNSNSNGGSGGGGGAYARSVLSVSPGQTFYGFVGAGGAGAAANSTSSASNGQGSWLNSTGINLQPSSVTNGILAVNGNAGVNNSTATPSNRGLASLSFGNSSTLSGTNGSAGSSNGGGNGGNGANSGGAGGIGVNSGASNNGSAPGGAGSGSDDNASQKGGNGGNGRLVITYSTPEIEISGNGITIIDGATTSSTTNHTYFGITDVNTGSISRTFTIQNSGTDSDLILGFPTLTGTHASEFTITSFSSTTVASGGFTTLTIAFNPSSFGTKTAYINITNNDLDENPYTFCIEGNGMVDNDGDSVDSGSDLDDDNDGISDAVECRTCTTDPFQNGSFETPVIGAATYSFVPTANVTGWQTSAENVIEIWSSGFNGVTAAAGNQFAELNANVPGVLYQTFCLNGAGGTISYSLKHRARSGVDTAYMKIGTSLTEALASTPVQTLIDGTSDWGTYSGTYIIPLNTSQIVITFQAGSTGSGNQSIGNFIDDIQISINQNCFDTDSDGLTDVNDLDSDNDGIPDIEEAGFKTHSNGLSTFDKTNSTSWIDANGNGYNDIIESLIAAGTYSLINTDSDAVPNYIDLDSDNDSFFDTDEAGLLFGDGDISGDGKGDYTDVDIDGIMDIHDNYTGFGTSGKTYAQDIDNDGIADFMDLNSDNNGGFDIASGLYAALDTDNDGRINGTADSDFDGIIDTFDTNTTSFGSPRDLNQKFYLNFDGRNDYAEDVNLINGLTNASMMGWIDLSDTFAATGVIMGQTNFQIRVSNSRVLQAVVNGTTYSYTPINSLSTRKWYHVAVTLGDGSLTLYVNGVPQTYSVSGTIGSDSSVFTLGKNPAASTLYFNGKMDEVRVFNVRLTDTQVQRMVNQEIENNSGQIRGTFIPKNIESANYSNLLRNYRMDTFKNDISDNYTSPSIDTGTGLKLYNHKLIVTQEAPMPYVTLRSGDLATAVHDATKDIDGTDILNYDWNIIDIRHNITERSNSTDLAIVINSGVKVTMDNDTKMQNAWYLKLDGILDLEGSSQLVQTITSELDVTSSGYLERNQQGTKNIFNYNYWSSPVGTINDTTNNNSFSVNSVMKDGTTNTPQNITWTGGLNGSATSPITLSSYWIFKFQNLSNDYANWQSVGSGGSLNTAQGFTLKGSGAAGANQNYTFVGKPNNGLITTTVAPNNLNLAGNPYASALDANAFITANSSSTTGALYFWEHSSTNNTHNLIAYQGGYSVRNLVGGTPPTAPAGISGVGVSTKVPQRFIPVSQGFFIVGSGTGGTVTFNNNQRAFIKEDNVLSTSLFRSNNNMLSSVNHFTNNQDDEITTDSFKKIRLGLTSKNNYHRQILLGFMNQLATNAIDFGYDAVNIDNQLNDIYFINTATKLVIQGDGNFDVNNTYPIGIKTSVTGEVKIMVDTTENFTSGDNLRMFIHDNTNNQYHEITYHPYIVELPQGITDNRFTLTFKDNSAALANDSFNIENGIEVAYANIKNILNIKNNMADATVEHVLLYNLLGQLVTTFEVENQSQQNIQLPISGISSGTYIVKVKTDKDDTSRKIVFN
jgi:hypothetical protein